MIIKVLGMGCPNCKKLEAFTKAAIKDSGIGIEIQKITDINEIISHGVIKTPSLIINNKIKSQGKIPDAVTIKRWIIEALQEN